MCAALNMFQSQLASNLASRFLIGLPNCLRRSLGDTHDIFRVCCRPWTLKFLPDNSHSYCTCTGSKIQWGRRRMKLTARTRVLSPCFAPTDSAALLLIAASMPLQLAGLYLASKGSIFMQRGQTTLVHGSQLGVIPARLGNVGVPYKGAPGHGLLGFCRSSAGRRWHIRVACESCHAGCLSLCGIFLNEGPCLLCASTVSPQSTRPSL